MKMPSLGPGTRSAFSPWWPNPERAEWFPGCDLSRLLRRDAVPGTKVSVVSGRVNFVSAFRKDEFGPVSRVAERRLD